MKIFSWNVNGLRAVMGKNFGEFIEEYAPDILCLQETKISEDLEGDFQTGFKYQYFHCAEKKGYSGTAVFSNIKPEKVESFTLKGHPREGRILMLDFGNFKLVNVYVPNSKSGLERLGYRENSWGPDFRQYLRDLGSSVIVCGDFNVAHAEIDLARPKSNRQSAGFTDEEREDFSKLLEFVPLVDLWRQRNPEKVRYTWWSYRAAARSKNIGWRIDYFLTSPNLESRILKSDIHDSVLGSDHCPVSIELDAF